MRPYQYRCNDFSLLTPPFKKWIITPLIRFVPWAIPANIITLISNFFVYFGLYVALHPNVLGMYTPLCISGCFMLYLIGDHLDGMQAKRTGTGSALGEFCDHYLDAFNNGIMVFTMFTVFNFQNVPIMGAVIVVSYLAHMAVFYEQLKTGWLTFERVGSLEGVILSAAMIGLSIIPSFYELMVHPLIGGFTVAEIIIICSAFGALATFIQTWKRTPDVKIGYWIFSGLFVITCIMGVLVLNGFQLFTVLTLYASLYVGRLMYGHLIDGVEYHADWIIPAAMLVYFGMGFSNTGYIFWILTAYLAARILILIVKTFSTLGVYWVWQNART